MMSTKLRVFISSTMKDLANERDAVVRKISEFNFEPVNAESWLPDGRTSWERIEGELRSSHLFVLILGERYGWIPDEGPGAERGLSVTHLETEYARRQGIPILPFLKELDYDETPKDTSDAKQRDRFRKEIRDWSRGLFIGKFKLASDLAHKVGSALVGVLSESFLSSAVADRAKQAAAPRRSFGPSPVQLNSEVVEFMMDENPVLLAGAGVSLSAGYPSAKALVELLHQEILKRGLDAYGSMVAGSFQDLADAFVAIFGRDSLERIIAKALDVPQEVLPTPAHMRAVHYFRHIVTTNYDDLFERAADEQGVPYRSIVNDPSLSPTSDRLEIFKLDGTISDPGSLVMTASDAFDLRKKRSKVFARVTALLREAPLLVVGHSLRHINIKQILSARSCDRSYYVAPDLGEFESLRLERFGFQPIVADASAFFEALPRGH